MKRTDYCGRIDRRYLDQTVTLMGWVHRRRDHGGVIFVDLRDREGLVQIVFNPDRVKAFPIAESLRSEYVIRVTGVFAANMIGQRLVRFGERVLARIPVFNSIYHSVKQVSDTLFHPGGQAFRKTLLVQWP